MSAISNELFGYHVASRRHKDAIAKEGLKPQDTPDYTPGVYATYDKGTLEHFFGDSSPNRDIYKISVPRHEVEDDPQLSGAFFTRNPVPAHKLSNVGHIDEEGKFVWSDK